MKKTTKKFLTLALSTLFVGAGVGAATTIYYNNNANIVASAEDATLTTVDMSSSITLRSAGQGDYADTINHFRLNVPQVAGVGEWKSSTLNPKLPASVLDNILVNGKSITQHTADYKAALENGETVFTDATGFPGEIAEDINLGNTHYTPIMVKLTNHGAALAGSTMEIYIPKAYLALEEIERRALTHPIPVTRAMFEEAFAKNPPTITAKELSQYENFREMGADAFKN